MSKLISQQSIDYYEEYKLKYGLNTIVLMQVGSFYEIYAVDFIDSHNNLIKRGPDVKYLEQLLDISIAHKGQNKNIYDYNNPYMLGFPLISEEYFIEKLINNGYTVITIIQVVESNKTITRKVDKIYSPGTYIMYNKSISNFIICIFIEEFKNKNYAIGLSAVDITTGQVLIHESLSDNNDTEYCFDDTLRFLNSINPSEIIIYTKSQNKNKLSISNEELIKLFILQNKNYQIKEYINDYIKINFQRKFFIETYKTKSMIDIFDYLNIADKIYCRISLIHNLKYIYEHNTNLILNLNEPSFYFKNSNLLLGNDALNQLSIINKDDRYYDDTYNINSLLSIINISATMMGKRYIKNLFSSPLTNSKKLQKIYNTVDNIMKLDFKKIHSLLKNISDIERLNRNVLIKCIKYNKFVDYIKSFNQIIYLINYLNEINFNENINKSFININKFNQLKSFVDYLNNSININNSLEYTNNNIINIFNKGIFEDIDKLQIQLIDNHEIINKVLNELNKLFDEKIRNKNNPIILKQNKIRGYYYQTTIKRFEYLENKLKNNTIEIDNIKINFNDFVINKKKNVEFFIPFLQDNNKNINDLLTQIDNLIYIHFMDFLDNINNNYQDIIKYFIKKIILIDYYTTIALVSDTYKYTKPIIEKYTENQEQSKSYVEFINLRHPIVEQLIKNKNEYIPHSLTIGKNINGIMLYGLNSAGKSVLMKAIGINIIMAQCGFFVAAEKFKYYPYRALYTRITGNDNIFKGLSSYMLEMTELNNIIKRADDRTLIIGDEICRGTEQISGNIIVASTIIKLLNNKSNFIFATHLHDIMNLEQIKSRKDLKAYHLSVSYKDGKLFYDRQLKEGIGDRIYGITIAEYVINDKEFKNIMVDFKKEIIGEKINYSKYNTELLLYKCEICGCKNSNKNKLITHHINFQKDCVNGVVKNKPYINKNDEINLVCICEECHNKVHHGNLIIKGKTYTNEGYKVLYEYV